MLNWVFKMHVPRYHRVHVEGSFPPQPSLFVLFQYMFNRIRLTKHLLYVVERHLQMSRRRMYSNAFLIDQIPSER